MFCILASCSSKKYIPENVKEISPAKAEQCLFVDDLKLVRTNVSKQKFDLEIRMMAAEKKSDSFVIEERINNGKKMEVIGSLFNCSK